MQDTKTVAVALIKNGDGKYLLIKSANLKEYGDLDDAWYPPSGHAHNGESTKNAAIREIKEELNLDIKPIKSTRWAQDVPGEIAFWWNCEVVGGEIKKMDGEIADFGYFSPEEIKNLKLWPATKKFFEKFIWI